MITSTVLTRQEGSKVAHYYAGGADDYYAKDGTAMQWQGEGAKALGLGGEVDATKFRELLNGKLGEGQHMRRVRGSDFSKERLGYDLTFSAPKGVSLQALVHGDHRVIEAHNKAVTAAINEAESFAKSRKTVNKKTMVENTGKLVVGKFRHETSREQEPELHTHAVVLNMTQRKDGQWRALTSDGLYNARRHLGNVYKAELAKELEKSGFLLRFNRNGTFDMAHFTEDHIKSFSARSEQIEARLDEQGLTRDTATREQKNRASLMTRKEKGEVDRDTLHASWVQRAKELGIDFESRQWAGAGADKKGRDVKPSALEEPITDYADRVLRFAIDSTTEREAIVAGPKLEAKALDHGMGRLSIGDIRGAVKRSVARGHLIRGERLYTSASDKNENKTALSRQQWIDELKQSGRNEADARRIVDTGIEQGRLEASDTRYTTQIAQQRERSVLKMERQGRGVVKSNVPEKAIARFLAGHSLSDEQAKAVRSISSTNNRYIGVQGFAGTGKSHMTLTAKDLLEDNGYRVTSLAPYASQKKALEADGMESRTVASFLRAKDKKIDKNTVVILDEAGLVPARQMYEVMKTVEDHGARAVLLGDTAQTKAIEAGKPFDQLQKAGMETAHLTQIQRQKNPELLEAVQQAAEGNTDASIPHISRIEDVKEPEARYQSLTDSYTALSADEQKDTLIVTGTNESRHKLNDSIRTALGLAGQGQTYDLLNRLDTTQAERQHSKYYEQGAVIIPEKSYKNGLERGKQYTVKDTGPGNRLTVESDDGKSIQFSPRQCRKLSVYQKETTELAAGDRIRITRNDASNDLANGDRFTVQRVDDKRVFAENDEGRQIMLDADQPMFAGLAYVSTIHGAQGLTNDRVFMNVDTKSKTTTKDVYYVGISRARHEAVIFTDNEKRLANAVGRENLKAAALDLNRERQYENAEREYRHDKRENTRDERQHEREDRREEREKETRYADRREAGRERAREEDSRQVGI